MKATIDQYLSALEAGGNLRRLPRDMSGSALIDFSSNDYLGIAADVELRRRFFEEVAGAAPEMTASASRLLARSQSPFSRFEQMLSEAYGGRKALIFNSGYHANTGLIGALAVKGTAIVADKLVHASIIDGIRLSGAPFERFRHNDLAHLDRLCKKVADSGLKHIIVAESVYSMDGDMADLESLVEIKRRYPGALLYIDEAHGVGTVGPSGLGLNASLADPAEVDVVIGTLGKALASTGAFVITSQRIKDFAINRARSLIFSTALPPINILWSMTTFAAALDMDDRRRHLKALGERLQERLRTLGRETAGSHIQPFVIGNPADIVAASAALADAGFDVLPIRTPTVPPGTDRLRISLSAAHTSQQIDALADVLSTLPHS